TKNRAFRLLEVSLTEQDSVRFSSLVLLSPLPSLSCPNRTVKNLHLSGGAGEAGEAEEAEGVCVGAGFTINIGLSP
ncbi:MAG: hypothetical protein RIG63_10960, partial [Coleofasciculus chthonoplastes F3-SA18-01]|uniref:hypothetical protein n=1 Tax=Coleofasciculus chthonoplastes TaxID=64178 RepID=UPI0032FEC826